MANQQDTNVNSSKSQTNQTSESFPSQKQNQRRDDMGSGKDLKDVPKTDSSQSPKKSEQW